MINFSTKLIAEVACKRPRGYAADLASRGIFIDGGKTLVLKEKDYLDLVAKYRGVGVGDILHRILHPITWILDRLLGTDFANCQACGKRRKSLNKVRIWGRRSH